jgi:predicted ATPase
VRWRVPFLDEAVQLFIERAREVRPDLVFSEADLSVIAKICRQLEGIPLAIELAAARLSALSVAQLAAHLPRAADAESGLARSAPGTAAPRQRTLRATLDWSYNLLTEEERAMLRRLSVFAGGWMLDAVEHVCGSEARVASMEYWSHGVIGSARAEASGPQYAMCASLGAGAAGRPAGTLELLTTLVDKSLVIFEERERTHEASVRYRLLETVREYGRERLLAMGEAGAVSRLHRDFLIHLARDAHAPGSDQVAVLDRLADELANLRAALAWSQERDSAGGLRLMIQTHPFWVWRDHLSEGSEWLRRLLATRPASPLELRARGLWTLASLTEWQGNLAAAEALYEQGLAVAREAGDRAGAAMTLVALGLLASRRGAHEEAVPLLQESICAHEDVGWVGGGIRSRALLGLARSRLGEEARGMALIEESLALARRDDDWPGAVFALDLLGDLALERRDYPSAREFHGEKLVVAGVPGACRGRSGPGAIRGGGESAPQRAGATDRAIRRGPARTCGRCCGDRRARASGPDARRRRAAAGTRRSDPLGHGAPAARENGGEYPRCAR